MGKAFYRKYRSKKLSEVVGQQHITNTLTTALKNGMVSHAYLFTGPRGVGKTSVARILAHEINQLPYSDESTHLDIIEIDAASNRRIDEIRDIKDKVHTAPTSAKYKVYIIDEVHMLTKEAFNALLKTLEEPPAHVVFILATTEAHKLPETIISRTQRFTFKPIDSTAVVRHLETIAKQEGIKVTPEALEKIAVHGDGSFRDSISLLDQIRHVSDQIAAETIDNALGLAPDELVDKVVTALQAGDRAAIDECLEALAESGVDAVQFAHQLQAKLRGIIKQSDEIRSSDLELMEELARIGAKSKPHIALTLALYRPFVTNETSPSVPPVNTAPKPATATKPVQKNNEHIPPETLHATTESGTEIPVPEPAADIPQNGDEWERILKALKQKHNTLYGVVRMARPTIADASITLAFGFPFHMRRVNDEKNRRTIEAVAQEILGRRVSLVAIKAEAAASSIKPAPTIKKKPATEHLSNVSNIFGDAEIVES